MWPQKPPTSFVYKAVCRLSPCFLQRSPHHAWVSHPSTNASLNSQQSPSGFTQIRPTIPFCVKVKNPEVTWVEASEPTLQAAAGGSQDCVCCLVPLRLMPAVDGTLWKWSRLWNQATLAWVLALLQARLSLSVCLSIHPREGFPCLYFFLIHKYSSCA